MIAFLDRARFFLQRPPLFAEGTHMNILNSGFSRFNDDDFAVKASFIISQLTGNADFPTTNPSLASLQAARDELTQARNIPPGQARDTASAAARAKQEGLLQDVAANLELGPNVTEEMLATTGFDLRKSISHTGEGPATPANLRLKATGASGEVQFLFDASTRARAYQVQTAFDPNAGPWIDYDPFSSTRNVIARALPRAKDVWGRVRALGPNNTKSGWSDPATILVS